MLSRGTKSIINIILLLIYSERRYSKQTKTHVFSKLLKKCYLLEPCLLLRQTFQTRAVPWSTKTSSTLETSVALQGKQKNMNLKSMVDSNSCVIKLGCIRKLISLLDFRVKLGDCNM